MTKLTPAHCVGPPRWALPLLMLPVVALVVIASLSGPGPARACEPMAIRDPDIRASFSRFDRMQSPAAREICAVYGEHRVIQ